MPSKFAPAYKEWDELPPYMLGETSPLPMTEEQETKNARQGWRKLRRNRKLYQFRDAIMEMYHDGIPYASIATELGLSKSGVYRFIRKELDETGNPSRGS